MNVRRIALVAVITVVAASALASSALAGKPGGGGTTSSSSGMKLMLMDGATQAQHYGRITFAVSTSATATPNVGLRCYQGSNWVFDAYVGYFPGYLFDQWFTLKSNYWLDGVPATCNARLFYNDRRGREVVLSTMSFPVAP